MTESRLYVAHRLACVRVLGPGKRYALWLQGCLKRCPGCVFPQGRSLDSGGFYLDVEVLAQEIMAEPDLRGITVSGGEPFLQVSPLLALLRRLKRASCLDIMIYSGYTLQELLERCDPDINSILELVDILVDGEYRQGENNNSLYKGSDNQVIHFLSERYRPWAEKIRRSRGRPIEFVQEQGELFMVGLPPKNFEQDFLDGITEMEK